MITVLVKTAEVTIAISNSPQPVMTLDFLGAVKFLSVEKSAPRLLKKVYGLAKLKQLQRS